MGQMVTGDNNAYALLKEYYGEQKLEAEVFRGDAILAAVKKERIGGKYYPQPIGVNASGSTTSDYVVLNQNATQGFGGAEFQVAPGSVFSTFVIDPKEYLASQGDRAAFISIFAIRAFFALDEMRKFLSSCLYRDGTLSQGPVQVVDTTAYSYVDVNPCDAMVISPNMPLMFAIYTNGSITGFRSSTAVTVKSVADQPTGYKRIFFNTAIPNTVAVGDWIQVKGGTDANLLPNAPIGFGGSQGGWLPTVGNRTGTAWNAYIANLFFNVNRSAYPDRLAGGYILRQTSQNETYTQALLRGLKIARRQGSQPTHIVVNDDDYSIIATDALANRTFFQAINSSDKVDENEVTQGISRFQMAFSTSWINEIVDSPYCPRNYAYIIDINKLKILTISAAEKPLDKLPLTNEPGAPEPEGSPEPTTQFGFLWEDFYNVKPIDLASGPGMQVIYQFYGNFLLTNTAHFVVIQFN
jgi:hypothetical protein